MTKLKHITVSERNYHNLKTLGNAGDSFNDVVTQLLKCLQQAQSFPTQGRFAAPEPPNGIDSNG